MSCPIKHPVCPQVGHYARGGMSESACSDEPLLGSNTSRIFTSHTLHSRGFLHELAVTHLTVITIHELPD